MDNENWIWSEILKQQRKLLELFEKLAHGRTDIVQEDSLTLKEIRYVRQQLTKSSGYLDFSDITNEDLQEYWADFLHLCKDKTAPMSFESRDKTLDGYVHFLLLDVVDEDYDDFH